MKEDFIDLWNTPPDDWRCITTNLSVRMDGSAIMGRGNALQAATRYPDLPYELGAFVQQVNEKEAHHRPEISRVAIFPDLHLIAFPVKYEWHQRANLKLIAASAHELRQIALHSPRVQGARFWLPRPGCGNGHLSWPDVRPMIVDILPDNVIVITR